MIELALIIALIVLFLHATTREGMVLSFIDGLTHDWPVWLRKPLFDCSVCMTPWWGSIIVFVVMGIPFELGPIFSILMAGGINYIIDGREVD